MAGSDQRDVRDARHRAYMEADFKSPSASGMTVPAEDRIASALEYIAFQLGQINRKLDGITGASEKAPEKP